MPRKASLLPANCEAILDAWSAGQTMAAIAWAHGVPAHTVANTISRARAAGDPRVPYRWKHGTGRRAVRAAALAETGVRRHRRPRPRSALDQGLDRIARRVEAFARSPLGQRMATIAIPPAPEG